MFNFGILLLILFFIILLNLTPQTYSVQGMKEYENCLNLNLLMALCFKNNQTYRREGPNIRNTVTKTISLPAIYSLNK